MTDYQHDTVVPFKNSSLTKKKQVAEMFDRIAFRYDFLNRVLSGGIDRYWRKKAIRELAGIHPSKILDVATGTADMPVLLDRMLRPEKIVGIDISEGMLALGRSKIAKLGLNSHIELREGDSEAIKFPEASFEAVTVAFGVRNFQHLETGLQEMKRVLKPGGKLVILEFSKPRKGAFLGIYKVYLRYIAPGIGKLASGSRDAYQYLNESVNAFPEGAVFAGILNKTGFINTYSKTLSLGICTIYCGTKENTAASPLLQS
jgi:demethylmenaquinone methyltransferase / 2-methoxy-6-polyprenyl-1,4-benzoquinol methylase